MTPRIRVSILTFFAMVAFAGNSLLCRLALKQASVDPATFTAIRLLSGALVLAVIVTLRGRKSQEHRSPAGNWISAVALFVYAAAFSLAYVSLPASTGAILLFGAVQATMIGYGLWRGERPGRRAVVGLVCAFLGLVGLLLPGISAPPFRSAILMLGAGAAWGVYSLRGRASADPLAETSGNFLRALPFALAVFLAFFASISVDLAGVALAVISGAITSGIGYAVWYAALRGLTATTAASVQLSVPVLAAAGGIVFLGESLTTRYLLASVAILGGIAAVVLDRADSSRTELRAPGHR